MRSIDLRFQGLPRVITSWYVDGVLVDPGPESCLDALLAGLDGERPRAILLTHIHFDHAGAAGALVGAWPEVPVFVHERGAPHMASPERLLASTARLIGEDGVRLRWGGMAPVPEANLRPLTGGERILDGALRVEYTPGHAVHHVAYLHEASGWALVGDVAGVRIAPEATVIAPTPPPDVDLVAWPASLEKLRAWAPDRLCLSHSGAVTDTDAHLAGLERSLALQAQQAAALDAEAFIAWYREHLGERMAPDVAALYLEASPVEHMWRGLRRWHERRARRGAGR
ncbi:MAG: MBL-fold metallo-hydrolase superfamily [uncultured Solirubrobacteraceae bacterium]|uniref:MBL-fold metallo-hydrolase superfamily n=1 Tax=uncultured Solirubrobacteraceae bacterium TaxID=1162706 RepID=A0A6J4S0W5_9ACTN|nr:MAG: MBL-fold metallo-hydrolase superfamily [uncultured Solirubrobacteraceae bacterium]